MKITLTQVAKFILGVALLAALFSLVDSARAQSTKTPVRIMANSTDRAGKLYVSFMRDMLERSPRYKASTSAGLIIDVLTLDPSYSVDGAGRVTAVSELITMDGVILLHQVRVCGWQRLQSCASESIADLDDALLGAPAK